MPMIRLMNWNIQNFGVTKSGLKFDNYDVVKAIADVVVFEDIDIFVMLEVNTTDEATARRLTSTMLYALREEEGGNFWQSAVISPNTGREFYAFFIKDVNRTIPLPLEDQILERVLGPYNPIENAVFYGNPEDYDVLDETFPLLDPDVREISLRGRNLNYPAWPATRKPALGLFAVAGATPGNELLPIVACHFAPDSDQAVHQFNRLFYFSLLNGLAPHAWEQPVSLNVVFDRPGMRNITPRYWVVTGDFNVNYNAAAYAGLVGNNYEELGALPAIVNGTLTTDDTLFMTYRTYKTARPKSTTALSVRPIDNFFIRNNPGHAGSATIRGAFVPDIADDVRWRRLRLNESVDHYMELDQRGLIDNPYANVASNFAQQLTNKTTGINYLGALVGSRLISDHLPTIVELNIA
jgi:hypothetical protein